MGKKSKKISEIEEDQVFECTSCGISFYADEGDVKSLMCRDCIENSSNKKELVNCGFCGSDFSIVNGWKICANPKCKAYMSPDDPVLA